MKVGLLLAEGSQYQNLKPIRESDWPVLLSFNKGASLADTWTPVPVEGVSYGDKALPVSDFPLLAPNLPVFSQRAVNALMDCLERHGEVLPLLSDGPEYHAFNCMKTTDSLDTERSVITRFPSGGIMSIDRYHFFEHKLAEIEVFRLPDRSANVFVTDAFARRVRQCGLTGFRIPVVWDSERG